ncbi:hypothetical protein HXX76_002233 [Chlamydomonas incerta]|uniref:Uncharacterized protein n=1 Tax=Chlamydomonas incerta TaxID=51695 RepID=A0A835WAQ4_CHLIN|nr:hypothetical protein HXX76_002233 [Chlamydomonas incerta]|eukprot:KAG2443893.1 hypothetical protein HXX76_002233 [Chlamydomonas incerta]
MSVLVPHWSRDGIHADPQTGIKVATETLLSMILRTANHSDPSGTAERRWTGIAAIWLVTTASAWIDNKPVHWTGDPYEHTTDASYMYLPVVQHYGPVQLPWERPPPSMVYTPPARLLHINSGTLRMHLDADPFQLRLRTPGTADESWSFWSHMIGGRQGLDCAAGTCCPAWHGGEHPKPGYISTTVNSTCGWLLNATEVATHMKFNELHVLALKSYEHMGVMGVSVYAVGAPECPESSTVLQGGPQLLGNATIDCLWQQRMSTAEDEYMKLVPAPAGACIRINITVLPPLTTRPENKIKFLGFSLF